ncbi:toll/interleukin-1 receptor domain-containing protein [Leifsonia kafniensis]|uniref:toll/interleukin-1 receptor domain-containing protein n=1 Tax=Leifsonia kafniensis TaxID=475957 RepID=UPI0031E9E572
MFDPDQGTLQSQLPPELHALNATKWSYGTSADHLASQILRLVGLAEDERRLFVSYRQVDAAKLADQLRHELIDAGWDVFLDRFSIPPGADFQRRLDKELAEKAFVLLLETPTASGSPWVEHEIAFALQRRLGLMSLTLPDTRDSELYPALDSSARFRIGESDVVGAAPEYVLTKEAIRKVVEEVEQRHAAAYSLRRESAMLEASEELRRCGYLVRPLGEWTLVAEKSDRREVVFVTARAPEASDLRTVAQLRALQKPYVLPTRGWIVHPTEDIDTDRSSLIRWLSRHRQISSTPVMLLAKRVA